MFCDDHGCAFHVNELQQLTRQDHPRKQDISFFLRGIGTAMPYLAAGITSIAQALVQNSDKRGLDPMLLASLCTTTPLMYV